MADHVKRPAPAPVSKPLLQDRYRECNASRSLSDKALKGAQDVTVNPARFPVAKALTPKEPVDRLRID